MTKTSERANRLVPSVTLQISAKAAQMRSDGIDVIALSAGEPDFDTPHYIAREGIKAIETGFTKYTPNPGINPLKDAISLKMKRDHNLNYGRENILVSNGAKHSIVNVLLAVCNPGDEVIVPAPFWVSYPEQVKLCDAVPVIVQTAFENEYRMTAEQFEHALTERTKVLILNSPSNPTGTVYPRNELLAIAEVARSRDVLILSDEIYEKIIYDGEVHHTVASLDRMRDLVVVVNGVSKAYSMTGWRIGYAVGDPDIIKAASKIQSQMTSNACSISQRAAVTAIKGRNTVVERMAKQFDLRRQFVYKSLTEIRGFNCFLPKGAFYLFPDISDLYGREVNGRKIDGSVAFCDHLLGNGRVAAVPGAAFGSDANIRISYATSNDQLEKAMQRIREVVDPML